jgi:hypothetical protein
MSRMEDIVALQSRIADAERARIRAEANREAAEQAAARVREELHRDFGVTTREGAQQRLAQLTEELDTIAADIARQLDQIGL